MNTSHKTVPLLILGAGVAGLGAGVQAQRLGVDSLILEAESSAGGLCRSLTSRVGCEFDFGPKILILDDSENSKDLLRFLNGNYEKYPMQESVYLKDFGLVGFPIQRNLIDLPNNISQRIIKEIEDKLAHPAAKNYKEWLVYNYGEYLANNILLPYEEKKWQANLDALDFTWALSRPVNVSLQEIKLGAKQKLPPSKHYYYPRVGSIATLTQNMSKEAGNIYFNHKVESIDIKRKIVSAGGEKFHYDKLISTLPLDYMLKITKNDFDISLNNYDSALKQVDILVFHIVFKSEYNLNGTAVYFPENDFVFRRVSILKNLCPALTRPGYTSISVEVSIGDALRSVSETDILSAALKQLKRVRQFSKLGDPIETISQTIPGAYPLPTVGLSKLVKTVHEYYKDYQVYFCGRGGCYNYCNCDVAYRQGKETALLINT